MLEGSQPRRKVHFWLSDWLADCHSQLPHNTGTGALSGGWNYEPPRSAFIAAVVIGSRIAGQQLSPGNVGPF